jgi:hypothetical protein
LVVADAVAGITRAGTTAAMPIRAFARLADSLLERKPPKRLRIDVKLKFLSVRINH